MTDVVVAIMAGGAGTRFWPASTNTRPKQFLALAGERTLLQQSYDRARAVSQDVIVVTSAAFTGLVHEQLPAIAPEDVVGEPERKDTAAAAVLATLLAEKKRPGCVVVILTSDHVITPVDEFARTVNTAVAGAAKDGALYTIGIAPTYPATGFGYLELGPLDNESGACDVVKFVEKPNLETATAYVNGGKHAWNAGMFVWQAQAALAQMRAHLPIHVRELEAAVASSASASAAALAKAFLAVPKVSIDYGLMEKAARVRCVKASFAWADVGSFPATAQFLDKDASDNAHRGRVVAHEAERNVVWSADHSEIVALVGVTDLVVVRAGKRTLVAHKDRAEEIKKLVDTLASDDKE